MGYGTFPNNWSRLDAVRIRWSNSHCWTRNGLGVRKRHWKSRKVKKIQYLLPFLLLSIFLMLDDKKILKSQCVADSVLRRRNQKVTLALKVLTTLEADKYASENVQ